MSGRATLATARLRLATAATRMSDQRDRLRRAVAHGCGRVGVRGPSSTPSSGRRPCWSSRNSERQGGQDDHAGQAERDEHRRSVPDGAAVSEIFIDVGTT